MSSEHAFYTNEIIRDYTHLGLTVDSNNGGLLLGPSHCDGGIPVLVRYSDGYRHIAEFEGFEYLLNPGASRHFKTELEEINNEFRNEGSIFSIPEYPNNITVINCISPYPVFKSKFLLTDARGGHFIVNKFSTVKHILRLEEMNSTYKWKLIGEPFKWIND